jgi:hypothetical protein
MPQGTACCQSSALPTELPGHCCKYYRTALHKDFGFGRTKRAMIRLVVVPAGFRLNISGVPKMLASTEPGDETAWFQSSALPTELSGHLLQILFTLTLSPIGGEGIFLDSGSRLNISGVPKILASTESGDETAWFQSSALPTELPGHLLQIFPLTLTLSPIGGEGIFFLDFGFRRNDALAG